MKQIICAVLQGVNLREVDYLLSVKGKKNKA